MKTQQDIIVEAYENMYSDSAIIVEAVHPEIQDIMDSDKIPHKQKLLKIATKTKELIKSGKDTGMESDKPVKGSSRAVFFPKETKPITVDGVKTSTPTAVKIPFHSKLDDKHKEETTLGQDQTALESDHYINHTYGVLHNHGTNDNYKSSTHESGGVLAPVLATHPDNHYLEMGRVSKFNAKDFSEATKTPDYPKGISFTDAQTAMMHSHSMAHGQGSRLNGKSEEHNEKISNHPWVDHAISMMHDSGMHPADVAPRNMGIYTHPVTGKKHGVMIDYGFSNDIAKKYRKAKMAK